MAARRTSSRASSQTTLRHVWLAGLGVVAISRREILAAPSRLAARAGAWQGAALRLAEDARSRVREVQPQVVRLGADLEARLTPVLEKFGLKKARRTARKATRPAHRPQGRRTTRKTAKRATRRK